MKKINIDVDTFEKLYLLWLNKYGQQRNEEGIRFGQHIWNKYGVQGETWPEVFYAETTSKAYAHIIQYLVENE